MVKKLPALRMPDSTVFGNRARRPVWKDLLAFLVIVAVVAAIYGNGLHADWHLDDFDNIVNNPNVHLKSLSRQGIEKSLHGMEKSGGHISRPVSYLSFALNYCTGGLNVFGYHAVNIAIHGLVSIVLFLLIRNILLLPIFEGRYEKQASAIALAATVLWATSPVQVTAVTYIVQRMASLAGLFYILTLYLYMKARTSQKRGQRIIWAAAGVLSALCAFGSKENTLMLPVILLLFDLLLLREFPLRRAGAILIMAGLFALAVLTAAFCFLDFSTVAGNYDIRPFTMGERLLTEPRVLFLYASLLLFPLPSRLMLYHDITWSTSFLSPPATAMAVIAIGVLFLLCIALSRMKPLIVFCILFFLLNHIIEGSFISLELIFEHRNYIPSMFFFLPLVLAAAGVLNRKKAYVALKTLLVGLFVFTVVFQMYGTVTRNATFATRIGLLADNSAKAPRLSVIHHNLGVEYYNRQMYREAYDAYTKALQENRYMNLQQKGLTYYNLGLYFQYVAKDAKQAQAYYEEAKHYTTEMDDAITQQRLHNDDGHRGKAKQEKPSAPRS